MLNKVAENYKNSLYSELKIIGKRLSSNRRLEILDLLSQGPKKVENIAYKTGVGFANTSRHLQILKGGQLVTTKKEGNYVLYILVSRNITEFVYLLGEVGEEQFDRSEYNSYTLTLDEPYPKIKNNEILLVDFKPADEYLSGHIEKANNIPTNESENKLKKLSKDTEIIVYCRGKLCAYENLA